MKLYDKRGSIALDIDPSKEINRGGEGAIFVHPTDSSKVVKVYHTNGALSEQSLSELMKLPDNFIKPLELFYDKTKKIKGLSMKYLDTHKLSLLSHIFSKAAALKGGYTDRVKKDIYEGIIVSVIQAHKQGVVIGDLNPYNIFVNPKGQVYFIDVDSFQTPSKLHSGVLLPEIRDWLQQNIDQSSDYFAVSVLVFQLFTHVHPYKGVHTKIKTLEERMIKKVSLLSGDKELIIPSFYEPFSTPKVAEQFFDIFQNAKRFIPLLAGQVNTMPITPRVSNMISITEGQMNIKVIDTGVEDMDCSDNYLYTKKLAVYTIYGCKTHSTVQRMSNIQTEAIFLGNKNVLYSDKYKLRDLSSARQMTNFQVPLNSFIHTNGGNVVYFDEDTDTYSILDIDEIFNGTSVNFHNGQIFVKSVSAQTGLVQTILGAKWILDISSGHLRTLRTTLVLHDVYLTPSGRYGTLSIRTAAGIEYYLFAVDGMRIKLGPQLNSLSIFAEKGDYLHIPSPTGIDVYRKLDLVKIAAIACRFVNEQSVVRSCNAGLLCLTGDTLYLLNKT